MKVYRPIGFAAFVLIMWLMVPNAATPGLAVLAFLALDVGIVR